MKLLSEFGVNILLQDRGFKPLSDCKAVKFITQYKKYTFEYLTMERLERERMALNVLELLKGSGVNMGSISNRKKYTIKDKGLLEVLADGVQEYANKMRAQAEWAGGEDAAKEAWGEYRLKGNQMAGILANYLLAYGKEDGVFTGKGRGTAKEYAAIYDILVEGGVIKPDAVKEKNSTKYKIIVDAMRAANKMKRGKGEPDISKYSSEMLTFEKIKADAEMDVIMEYMNESNNES